MKRPGTGGKGDARLAASPAILVGVTADGRHALAVQRYGGEPCLCVHACTANGGLHVSTVDRRSFVAAIGVDRLTAALAQAGRLCGRAADAGRCAMLTFLRLGHATCDTCGKRIGLKEVVRPELGDSILSVLDALGWQRTDQVRLKCPDCARREEAEAKGARS